MSYNDVEKFLGEKLINISYRNLFRITIDLALISIAYYFAFNLRFDFSLSQENLTLLKHSGPIVVLTTFLSLMAFKNYQRFWRFFSGQDAVTLFWSIGTIAAISIIFPTLFDVPLIPRSVILIYSLLSFLLLMGVRSFYRYIFASKLWRFLIQEDNRKNTIIVGAGHAGELLVRQMLNKQIPRYRPIGFVDDSKEKRHIRIHGIQVLGKVKDLPQLVNKYHIEEILIAIPSVSDNQMRNIVGYCQESKVPYKTLPSINNLSENLSLTEQIREVKLEDLLSRSPIRTNINNLRSLIEGKVVLITGSAGSIGSEITRQVLRLNPKALIGLDRHENGLFYLEHELAEQSNSEVFIPVIADIQDTAKLESIFSQYQPDYVFHAAAYKHVPLMELYPEESFKNNILGTLNVAKAAVKSNVEKFVLISTDKAVNPTSIMGASKRIAELAVKCYAKKHPETKFITVRFGNVLGSQGSVLLTFKKQIEQGGPVTVTHPEMKRYFMTIPEAVQLILEAARMGKGEEIYILNMGEPVKIVDFARQLIRLSGFKPDEDIAIKYTGMRPGEKLFEELWFSYEKPIGTEHPKINKAINNNNKVDWEELELYLDRLLEIANNGSPEELVKRYKALIPEFTPDISIHF